MTRPMDYTVGRVVRLLVDGRAYRWLDKGVVYSTEFAHNFPDLFQQNVTS